MAERYTLHGIKIEQLCDICQTGTYVVDKNTDIPGWCNNPSRKDGVLIYTHTCTDCGDKKIFTELPYPHISYSVTGFTLVKT